MFCHSDKVRLGSCDLLLQQEKVSEVIDDIIKLILKTTHLNDEPLVQSLTKFSAITMFAGRLTILKQNIFLAVGETTGDHKEKLTCKRKS